MRIRSCRLIALDLDGTLLNGEKKIDPDLILYLRGLVKKGIKLTLISGRHYDEMRKYAAELGMKKETGYIVSCDGAYIMSGDGNVIYKSNLLTMKDVLKFTENNLKRSKVYFYSADRNYIIGRTLDTMLKRVNSVLKKDNRSVFLNRKYIKADEKAFIEKIVIKKKKGVSFEEYKKLRNLHREYNIDYLSVGNIEIRSAATSKLQAMQYIIKSENLENEEIIVFGDEGNDIEMLSCFRYSYAMGNADERVKRSAKYVTDSNENRGIYKALKALFEEDGE